jgi:hypothetical protein
MGAGGGGRVMDWCLSVAEFVLGGLGYFFRGLTVIDFTWLGSSFNLNRQPLLPQRAFAARWAISVRSCGVSFAALAMPPFMPPSFPSATAAGFFLRGGNDSGLGAGLNSAPVACSTTRRAFCATSPLLERLGMLALCHDLAEDTQTFFRGSQGQGL